MLPFTPRRKDNLAAWMVARSDGNRGTLARLPVPEAEGRLRPAADRRADQPDQVISPQITLWNQQGSQVIRDAAVIPIEQSLLSPAALSARVGGGYRVEARHRRASESDRDGGDAAGGVEPDLRSGGGARRAPA